jgi:nucleoside-diphosphate-sugar epimerase
MATYFITGIAGFIGSSLAHALVERGQTVRGADNLVTGDRDNLKSIASKIDFRELDILDLDGLRTAMRGADYVFHEAALASVPRSVKDPAASNAANVTGTLNVLLASREAGVKRVVYAASSSAYGDTPTLPKTETMLPNPISPYAVSKLAGEHYMTAFYRVYGLETVSLRYFNVFGPRQAADSPYSGVLAKFITKMLAGERPTIEGDGEQSRDFTFVSNVVDANLLACSAPAERVAGQMFNVAIGERINLNQTYAILQKLTGYNVAPAYTAPREGDVKHSLADIMRAREALGYTPKVGFEEGLRQTVAWYREHAKATAASRSH